MKLFVYVVVLNVEDIIYVLGGSFVFTEVINEYHGFLARNAVLLKSCCYNNDNNENFNQKNNEDNINYGDEDI